MANSNIITTIKNHVIKTLIKDANIVAAIDSSTVPKDKPEELLYTHIFDYNQNPYKVEDVGYSFTLEVLSDVYVYAVFKDASVNPSTDVVNNNFLSSLKRIK